MRVLYIYRHPDMGYSIGKVFKSIEMEMRRYAEVESLYLPVPNYSPKGLWKNIKAAKAAIIEKEYDLVHITGTENYLIPFINKTRTVVTVHDIGFFTNECPSFKSFIKYCLFVRVLKKASKVIFISDTSKETTEKYVRLNPDKIAVIANPVSNDYVFTPKLVDINKPIVLHLGTKPNKNLDRTIEALKDFPCKLRIVGPVPDRQILKMKEFGMDYAIIKDLTDEQIVEEYQKCDIVNFPSLQEGFGLPIIEGQAIGRLVVTSRLQPMMGIAGNGAILVDPTDVDSIKNGYKIAMSNYQEIVKLGKENVRRYNLNAISQKYLAVYKELCKK